MLLQCYLIIYLTMRFIPVMEKTEYSTALSATWSFRNHCGSFFFFFMILWWIKKWKRRVF